MDRKSVLVLFGGESSEHEVSIASARNVFAAIDDTQFDVVLGYIDRHGKWWLLESIGEQVSSQGAAQLVPVLGSASLITLPYSRIIKPDVILPILHGKNGEDGSVQGLAQLLHVPVVGCDVAASAICMNKATTKELLSKHAVPIAAYVTHSQSQPLPDFNQLSMQLGLPLFVKPARAGSSVGVSKVYSEEDLQRALDLAHQHDELVLIEQGIVGRELEVGVLGNPPHHQVSGIGEVLVHGEFYNYEEKYSAASSSQVCVPAELEAAVVQHIQERAHQVYEILGCRGLARIDFFLTETGEVLVNEVNTMPGFTNTSMYPKLWRHEGVSYGRLIERLIFCALDDTMEQVRNEEV
jgi:D-alanine-D-alanine ligase